MGTSLNHLRIPVNPEYSWDVPPDLQDTAYVNPVELNNKLMQYANDAINITQYIVKQQRARTAEGIELKAMEQALLRFRNDLLGHHPPPTADRKSNQLLEAYIERIAFETGKSDELYRLTNAVSAQDAVLTTIESELESAKQVYFLLKELAVNIQTHLSFRKHEYNQIHGR